MNKRRFVKIVLLMSVVLLACSLVILGQHAVGSSILLPLNAFVAAAVLFHAYVKSNLRNLKRASLLLLSVACFAWGLGDSLWVLWEMMLKDPSASLFLSSIYLLTNLCMAAALLLYALVELSKWNNIQLQLDAVIIGSMALFLIWITYLNKDSALVFQIMASNIAMSLSVLLDVILSLGIVSFLLSVRSGKVPFFLKIITTGELLFCFTDLLYYYADLNALYLPNSLIDFLYALSLQAIALGAVVRTYAGNPEGDAGQVTNIGSRKGRQVVLVFPLAAICLELFMGDRVSVTAMDLAILLFMILLHWSATKHVQQFIEHARLLEQEKQQTKQLKQKVSRQNEELLFLANQDPLTALLNRRYFLNRLEEAIQSFRSDETLALVLLDIDRFKAINEEFGPEFGDQVLIAFSERLTVWNDHGAILSRLGGDEFAVFLTGHYTNKELETYCRRLIAFCNEPIGIDGNTVSMTISLGIALYTPDICDSKQLLKLADMSIYMAKSQGYNKIHFYDPMVSEELSRTRKIESLLKHPELEKDFELYYQPQFSLPDRTILGAEALIRWNHPEHGYIPPNLFIPIAEESGMIFKIGSWVMQESIRQAITWNQTYETGIKVGFNISSKQLDEDGFIFFLKSLILDTGVNTAWLDAEITESVMLSDSKKIDELFDAIQNLGISISVDDFGTGYSALAYLNRYRFDKIKIDKSLIDHVTLDTPGGVHVVAAVISMAKAVGIKTIAEGVEHKEQIDILTELGCDEVQGYFLGRPVPAEEFEKKFLRPAGRKSEHPYGSKAKLLNDGQRRML